MKTACRETASPRGSAPAEPPPRKRQTSPLEYSSRCARERGFPPLRSARGTEKASARGAAGHRRPRVPHPTVRKREALGMTAQTRGGSKARSPRSLSFAGPLAGQTFPPHPRPCPRTPPRPTPSSSPPPGHRGALGVGRGRSRMKVPRVSARNARQKALPLPLPLHSARFSGRRFVRSVPLWHPGIPGIGTFCPILPGVGT
jgi:hypothetical protein